MPNERVAPRTFFLNETHEFTRGEKEGGGPGAKYAPIDWNKRGSALRSSIDATKKAVTTSRDPLKDRRYFMLAMPEKRVAKRSNAKNKPPIHDEETRYEGEHSRVFRRLGMDLLHVAPDGRAVVHSTPERVEQLAVTAAQLGRAGVKEQARWATISAFEPIPDSFRIDLAWAQSLAPSASVDVIVELQPLLTTVESDEVMKAVIGFLSQQANEAIVGAGTDFSGRHWYRGRAGRKAMLAIAKHLFSVESVHRPVDTPLNAGTRGAPRRAATTPSVPTQVQLAQMPVVAVVDGGVPVQHPVLTPYSRGQFIEPASEGVLGEHGSCVASRVVFGDLDFSHGVQSPPPGRCRFLDVVVSEDDTHVNAKSVLPAMEAVIVNYPDVRVFNLSFGSHKPLSAFSDVDRRERLIAMRDLDNFVFARDAVVVVAAGNSAPGVVPATPYPDHHIEAAWQLGSWSMGFNTLTCGATVGRASPNGLAKAVHWPSPFTRVGPGLCGAPVPEFGAFGGDCTPAYGQASPLGVYVCAPDGGWEDRAGTSYAAPLLAREAAFALQKLQAVCQPGSRPFAATVKAFLALTARRAALPSRIMPLADLTIGRGYASSARLDQPSAASVVLVWQGVLEGPKDIAKVQVPIPMEWLAAAKKPVVKLLWAWDSPVHDAVTKLWACRKVTARLKTAPDSPSVTGSQGKHKSYPIIERTFDLSADRLKKKKVEVVNDLWVVEIFYDEIAEYYPGMEFSPQQRVGLAVELTDVGTSPVSPQAAVQKLPIAATMSHLGVLRTRIASPVMIKVRR